MVIYTELLDCLDTAVDQSQSMRLATSETKFGQASIADAVSSGAVTRAVTRAVARAVATCKVHLSIDEIVVGWWSNEIFDPNVCPHHTFKYGEVVLVIVVVERYWAEIDIICVGRWAVYYLLTS